MSETSSRALILVPTYNERDNLEALVRAICKYTSPDVHVLVVDDNSPDGTGKIADTLAAESPRVHVLHRAAKQGLGRAYLAGFDWGLKAGYDILVEMDADFSHDPKYLPEMLAGFKTHDVVVGSRYVPGGGTVNWGLGRKILSRGGSIYARFILGATIRDFTGGFNGWTRKALLAIDLPSVRSNGYSFQIELKYRAHLMGLKIKEFPIIFVDRKVGQSKMSKKIVFEALSKVWQFRMRATQLIENRGANE